MGQKYLIDTCAAIKYLNGTFPSRGLSFMDNIIDEDCVISFITKIEILAKEQVKPEDKVILSDFISGSEILYINDEIINKAVQIRKETKIKLPDALIAATAIAFEFVLLSDNDKDFTKVERLGLKYANPKTAFIK